jgi:small acid-soluble spore protein H (minor)
MEWMVCAMDATRAREIINAKDEVDVELNGVSVWIDSVDETEATAYIHAKNDPQNRRMVSLDLLQEGGKRNVR